MSQRTWIAEVTDPTTGGVTVITATSESDLDRLVDAHLAGNFDLPEHSQENDHV